MKTSASPPPKHLYTTRGVVHVHWPSPMGSEWTQYTVWVLYERYRRCIGAVFECSAGAYRGAVRALIGGNTGANRRRYGRCSGCSTGYSGRSTGAVRGEVRLYRPPNCARTAPRTARIAGYCTPNRARTAPKNSTKKQRLHFVHRLYRARIAPMLRPLRTHRARPMDMNNTTGYIQMFWRRRGRGFHQFYCLIHFPIQIENCAVGFGGGRRVRGAGPQHHGLYIDVLAAARSKFSL